jgi:Xaa-Pro aminopeptidase
MESAIVKWRHIAVQVMRAGVSPQERDDSACMTKWNALYGEFKKIKDYHAGTGHNVSYFALTPEERDENGLPHNFSEAHYEQMHDFL